MNAIITVVLAGASGFVGAYLRGRFERDGCLWQGGAR
ncbi:hypothetical protein ABIB27_002400 [Arthrobacter sp. UYEF21]